MTYFSIDLCKWYLLQIEDETQGIKEMEINVSIIL